MSDAPADLESQATAATAGVPTTEPAAAAADPGPRRTRPIRRLIALAAFLAVLFAAWEGAKWLAGDPWRLDSLGYFHAPPFRVLQLSDRHLPHLWDIYASFGEPFQRN